MKRIAFLFRYGVKDHAELYPAIPEVLKRLGEKYEVLYIGPNRQLIPEAYRFPGVSYVNVPFRVNRASFTDKMCKIILWYFFLPFLSLYCRFWKADIIWIDESIPFAGTIVALFSGRPIALTVVDFFFEIYAEKFVLLKPVARIALAVDRWGWKKACGIFTHAEATRQYLIKGGVNPSKIRVVRDAVKADVFFPEDPGTLRAELGFRDGDIVICHHGILHPNKAIARVLYWLAPLMKQDDRYKLLIVGSGPEEKNLSNLAKELGITGRVVFTGWLPSHSEVNRHLNIADIGLVMRAGQFCDNFHVTGALLHCMMCELPVLATRLQGITEIVDEGEHGYMFDPDDGENFLLKLKLLGEDASGRREMGKRARAKVVQEFDPDRVATDVIRGIEAFMCNG